MTAKDKLPSVLVEGVKQAAMRNIMRTEQVSAFILDLLGPLYLKRIKLMARFLDVEPALIIEDWMVRNRDMIELKTGKKFAVDNMHKARPLSRLTVTQTGLNYLW